MKLELHALLAREVRKLGNSLLRPVVQDPAVGRNKPHSRSRVSASEEDAQKIEMLKLLQVRLDEPDTIFLST